MKLTAYDGTETPNLGSCQVYVKVPTTQVGRQAEIVDVNGPAVIGNMSAQNLNLLKLNWTLLLRVTANLPLSA